MKAQAASGPARAAAAILDVLLLATLVALCVAIIAPAVESPAKPKDLQVVCAEARNLADGFRSFRARNGRYPDGNVTNETDVLEQLRGHGYYSGHITKHLLGGHVDAYDTQPDRGQGLEYWLEMTLAADPTIRFLVARSDDAPLGHGNWREGVFLFRDGKLEPIR